jgi:uncharacterized protein
MGDPPVPPNQFVLNVHSRCDLACDRCYVYEAANQSWRSDLNVRIRTNGVLLSEAFPGLFAEHGSNRHFPRRRPGGQ